MKTIDEVKEQVIEFVQDHPVEIAKTSALFIAAMLIRNKSYAKGFKAGMKEGRNDILTRIVEASSGLKMKNDIIGTYVFTAERIK